MRVLLFLVTNFASDRLEHCHRYFGIIMLCVHPGFNT